MKKSSKSVATAALAGVMALSLTSMSGNVLAKEGYEKCKGIAVTGKNDCGANGHSCGGKAATDFDPEEWNYVPTGTCEHVKMLMEHAKEDDKFKEIVMNAINGIGGQ